VPGSYGVEPVALAPLVATELGKPASPVDLLVVADTGKMELYWPEFVTAVQGLLGGPVPLVATVALAGGGLVAEVKGRDDVWLVEG
jgi:nucleoside-triphosphatase THEP1